MTNKFLVFNIVTLFVLATLAACGGGGGGGATAPNPWGTASAIETNVAGVYAGSPQVGIDANGNVLAVFAQYDGTRNNIMANRYSAASRTWGTATLVETDNAGDASSPQLAIDPSGNGLAVWYQSDGTRYNVWANRYTAATDTWGTAVLIETDNTGHAGLPQIAMDAAGNGLAVWQQSDGTRNHIWANRYIAGSTNAWGTAELIETDAGNANAPQIAIDADGNVLAVWAQDVSAITHIMANRYNAATGWGTAVSIASFNQGSGGQAQIAIDASGNAMAVWAQNDYPDQNIAANRYTAATNTWGTAQLIETGTFATRNPQVAVDANGNALAVWEHLDGVYSIAANRYTAATNTWGTAALIETDNTGSTYVPQIAIDANGNALAVWQYADETFRHIKVNRYTAGAGWGNAAFIENNNVGDAGSPQIAFFSNGNALAVWDQEGANLSSDIWTNLYK